MFDILGTHIWPVSVGSRGELIAYECMVCLPPIRCPHSPNIYLPCVNLFNLTIGCRNLSGLSQGWCKTRNVFVPITLVCVLTFFTHGCHMTVARLPCNDLMLYCTMDAARMLQTVQLPMKFARLTHGRTCDSLANLQAHLASPASV